MTSAPALPCPKCRRVLEPTSWFSASGGKCGNCSTQFDFVGFPALGVTRRRVVPKAVLVAEHATCFFHAENQAEAVCASCGRFLCGVCAIDFKHEFFCPGCMAAATSSTTGSKSERVLYETFSLLLATLPLLMFPITLVTAPAALGMAIFAWNKPGSLVSRGRKVRLVVAVILALLQIIGWCIVGYFAFFRD